MIYTSYFSKIKNLPNYLEPISISRFSPKWYNGKNDLDLAPSEELLLGYKKGEINKEKYKEIYLKQLNELPKEKITQIKKDYKNKVLCCYEKSEDFCHRHILSEWLKEKEIEIKEKTTINIGVVGSRGFDQEEMLNYQLSKISSDYKKEELVIVSGGAKGADKLGEEWAMSNDIKTNIFIPDWDKYGKRAGFIRNADIVSNSDLVISFWDGKSNGTKNSQDTTIKQGKELIQLIYSEPNNIEIKQEIREYEEDKVYLFLSNKENKYTKKEKEHLEKENIYQLTVKNDKGKTKKSFIQLLNKEDMDILKKELTNIPKDKILVVSIDILMDLKSNSKECFKLIDKYLEERMGINLTKEEEKKTPQLLEF